MNENLNKPIVNGTNKNQRKVTKNKNHKWMVAGVLVTLFLMGFALSGFSKLGSKNEEMYLEEQQQLDDMTGYLGEIDSTVVENRERLAEAVLLQSDTEASLAEVTETLAVMQDKLIEIETVINKHKKDEQSQNSEFKTMLNNVAINQQNLKNQISDTQSEITSILNDMQKENAKDYVDIVDRLTATNEMLTKMSEDAKTYYEGLSECLMVMREENVAFYNEMIQTIETSAKELAQMVNTSSENLAKEIESSKIELSQKVDESTEKVTEEVNTAKDTISVEMDNSVKELERIMLSQYESLQIALDVDSLDLMNRLDELHQQINDTSVSVTDLLTMMEDNSKNRQEEINQTFEEIKNSINVISQEYTNAHTQLQNLIQKVQETMNENHEETLSVLTVMETNMEQSSIENLTEITNSLATLEENFAKSIENVQNDLSQVNNTMLTQFDQLNNNLTLQYDNIVNIVNNNETTNQTNFDEVIEVIEEKFNSVFQSVSSGKRLVASAILTKGVSCAEDATFQEIYDAIMSIEQTVVIGVDQIPGTIEYDYHYHVDGNGEQLHTDSCDASHQGGCYTIPVYHKHTGSSSKGGGCYTVKKTGTKTVSCEGGECISGPHGPDTSGQVYYVGNCTKCGAHLSRYGSPGYEHCDNTTTTTYTYYELGCGKTNKTITGYKVGCGLSDGQIIGARIVYVQDAVAAVSACLYEVPEEEPVPFVLEEEEPTELDTVEPTPTEPTTEESVVEEPESTTAEPESEQETDEETSEESMEETTEVEAIVEESNDVSEENLDEPVE